VKLRIGPRQEIQVEQVVSALTQILRGGSEFSDHLRVPPDSLATLLEDCDSISGVIEMIEARAL
jgi:hypothetical protein